MRFYNPNRLLVVKQPVILYLVPTVSSWHCSMKDKKLIKLLIFQNIS